MLLLFCSVFFNLAFAQKIPDSPKRGTIKVRKTTTIKYFISKETSLKAAPSMRIFRVRAYNYNFKEYFPIEYNSELFPLMLNFVGLIITDENRQATENTIISYEYEICKSQVVCKKGLCVIPSLNYPIREMSRMAIGSSVWIKNLAYKDKYGVIHRNKIGEFKIEKVK